MLAFLLLLAGVTDGMWQEAKPVYERTIAHPFLRELAEGTLAPAKFERYLIEDIAYLRVYGGVLRELAGKAPKAEWKDFLLEGAVGCEKEVKHIHEAYLRGRGREKAPSRANAAYLKFLRASVRRGSFAEGMAAVLPCYWIYWEVGKTLKARGSRNADYQRWIDYYSDPGYGKTVEKALRVMEESARGGETGKLVKLYVTGAEHEYRFWDSAYHLTR